MTPSDLRKLKHGDRLSFKDDPDSTSGTVIAVGFSGVQIQWQDKVISTFLFNAPDDPRLANLSLLSTSTSS